MLAARLRALGLPEDSLATFPEEFRVGAAGRAAKLGDVDGSAPEHWRDGLDAPDNVHLMWTVHALDDKDELDAVTATLESLRIVVPLK